MYLKISKNAVSNYLSCIKCSIGLRATVSAAARRCACFQPFWFNISMYNIWSDNFRDRCLVKNQAKKIKRMYDKSIKRHILYDDIDVSNDW